MKNFIRLHGQTYCLLIALIFVIWALNDTKKELAKAQPKIAMANMVIAAANSTPTNMAGVLIYVSRQK